MPRILSCTPILLFLTLLSTGWVAESEPSASVRSRINYSPPLTAGLKRDRAALLALRAAIFDFADTAVRASWSRSRGSNPCDPQWPHVICAGGRVVAVELGHTGIAVSQLPGKLARMDRLMLLDLSGKNIFGTLPAYWGRRLSFPRLQELNLEENNLEGTLPSWDTRRAWRSLRNLLLGGNNLIGSLPASWASGRKPLKKLVLLDLSDNFMGQDPSDPGNPSLYFPLPEGGDDWGNGAEGGFAFPSLKTLRLSGNFFAGTLPDWGKPNAYTNLRTLDLGFNQLTGDPPSAWGGAGAFPRLQTLILAGNDLGAPASPGGLPPSWTSRFVPRSFPRLQDMVLYPGNDNLCAWLDGNVQGGAAYNVMDDLRYTFSAAEDNTMMCPDPSVDNPPTSVTLSQEEGGGTPLALSWRAPDDDPGFACGYRVSLSQGSTVVTGIPKSFQVLPSINDTATLTFSSSTYTIASLLASPANGAYTASVWTLFCNTFTSTKADSNQVTVVTTPQ